MRAWLVCLVACGAPSRSSDPVKQPVAPAPAPPPAPAPEPEPTSAIPTVISPCDDVRQDVTPELVADFDHPGKHENPGVRAHPLLCWGDDCLWTGEPVLRPTARPVTIQHQPEIGDKLVPTMPVAIIKDGKVCTDQCDELGPRLRAAIAADPETPVRATSDRQAIVVGNEAWSRKGDAPLVLPPARRFEGDVTTILVLGNRLAVGRSCNEYCAEIGTIVDSRGRLVSRGFVFGNPIESIPDPIDLAGDRFLIFSGFGDATLIEKGKPVASTHVGAEGGHEGAAPVPARVLALALDSDDVALEVCTPVGCQLARLRVSVWSGTPRTTHLEYSVVRQLPRCSNDAPSY